MLLLPSCLLGVAIRGDDGSASNGVGLPVVVIGGSPYCRGLPESRLNQNGVPQPYASCEEKRCQKRSTLNTTKSGKDGNTPDLAEASKLRPEMWAASEGAGFRLQALRCRVAHLGSRVLGFGASGVGFRPV